MFSDCYTTSICSFTIVSKPQNVEMLNATHEVLAEEAGLSYAQIAERLAARGYPRPARQTVVSWVHQLIHWDLITADRESRIEPLMPAYLFLDLPTPAEVSVRRALEREQVEFEIDMVSGMAFNALVRTHVRRGASLEALRRVCLGAGATDARATIVLRRGPTLSFAS